MIHRQILALAATLIASPALAEAADKEPSVSSLWAWALGFNVIAREVIALASQMSNDRRSGGVSEVLREGVYCRLGQRYEEAPAI